MPHTEVGWGAPRDDEYLVASEVVKVCATSVEAHPTSLLTGVTSFKARSKDEPWHERPPRQEIPGVGAGAAEVDSVCLHCGQKCFKVESTVVDGNTAAEICSFNNTGIVHCILPGEMFGVKGGCPCEG
eukprot:1660659-Amphidinium_carterae.1